MALFLGIDIGTTNTKVLLTTQELHVVAHAERTYPLHMTPGCVEQAPEDWWEAVCEILQGFWQEGHSMQEVQGICVSGHGCSLVVMDQSGAILRPAISSLDIRSRLETEYIRREAESMILAHNGNAVATFNYEPKLLWLRNNEPGNYANMHRIMSPTSYINYRLTGVWAGNVSDLGIALMYDRSVGGRWQNAMIEAIGLDTEKYPDLHACSDIIGYTCERAAEQTGLPIGIPVLAGGEDTSSAALSLGVDRPGLAYLSMGTQCNVGVCSDQFASRPEMLSFPHVLPGLHLVSGSMSTCGTGIAWFLREFCKDLLQEEADGGMSAMEAFTMLAAEAPPGANGLLFLPYLSGELHPILDSQASGMFFGLLLTHTRADMGRAVLEGAAHAIAHNLFYAKAAVGEITELRATGGPAKNPVLCQAVADITGIPVKVMASGAKDGGAPLGNALLAIESICGPVAQEPKEGISTVLHTYEPNALRVLMYQQYHSLYRHLYEQNVSLLHELYNIKQIIAW